MLQMRVCVANGGVGASGLSRINCNFAERAVMEEPYYFGMVEEDHDDAVEEKGYIDEKVIDVNNAL